VKLVAWLSVTLSSFDPEPAPVDPAKPPVIIVHGIDGSALEMSRLARALRADGRAVFTPSLTPNDGSVPLEDLSSQLDTYIQAHVPNRPFHLIGYSMGGLITRHYLRHPNAENRVLHYLSISAPHHGTATAYLRRGSGALQMRPGSDFLNSLNQDPSALSRIPATSFWTPTDLIIIPPSSARLPGATNISKLGLGHFSFIMEKRRIQDIITALDSPPTTDH
jgi:triacylglycerol lipase